MSETYQFDTVGTHVLDDLPENLHQFRVELWGGEGAPTDDPDVPTADGGEGGYTYAEIPLEDDELTVVVGGAATDETGGSNGGGDGGSLSDRRAGGGGGASDVRQAGTTLADRWAVAAGGGGAGTGYNANGSGGAGGPETGEDGGGFGGSGGSGGSQDAGGSGGSGACTPDDGALGDGGNGCVYDEGGDDYALGGGGGGGWYGGGGGSGTDLQEGGGGGGGSNYVHPDATEIESTRGTNSGDGLVIVEHEPLPAAPSNLTVDDATLSEVSLSWDLTADDHDTVRVYRDTEPDVAVDESNRIAELSEGTTSYVDGQSIEENETYHYIVTQAVEDGESLASNEDSVAIIQAVETFALNASTKDELTVEGISPEIHAGEYRIQLRDDDPDGDHPDWSEGEEVTIAHDAAELEHTFTNLLDGEQYSVRVRSETDLLERDWVTAAEITNFPPVENIDVIDVESSSIELSWTRVDDNAETATIERDAELDNRFEPEFDGDWEDVATFDAADETYVDDNLDDNWAYRYRVRIETEWVYARAELDESVTTEIAYPDGISVELQRRDGEALLVEPSQVLDLDVTREFSAMSDAAIEIPEAPRASDWTLSELFLWEVVNDDRTLQFRGEFLTPGRDHGATTTIAGPDVIKKLDRGGASVEFDGIEGWDAIAEYADEYLEEWDVTIHEPEEQLVDEDLAVQTAPDVDSFDVVFTDLDGDVAGDVDPTYVKPLPTAAVGNASDDGSGGGIEEEPYYVNGVARTLNGAGDDFTIDVEFSESGYEIPEGDAYVAIRYDTIVDDGESKHPEFDLLVDGISAESFPGSALTTGPDWFHVAIDGSIVTGENEVSVEYNDENNHDDGMLSVDAAAVYDNRYDYTWDNEVHEDDGHLDGPEEYPAPDDGVVIEAVEADQSFNVIRGHLDVDVDGGPPGALELAFVDDDWSGESITDSIVVDNDNPTTTVRGRLVLGYDDSAGPRDDTPRFGYEPQRLTSWRLGVDTNSIAVFDEFEVTGSHFENLQTMHEEAGMLFTTEYDEDALQLESFAPGEVTRDGDWVREDADSEEDFFEYANRIQVYGAYSDEDEEEERLVATATSQAEVERIGDTVDARPAFRPEAESVDQLRNIARQLLSDRITATLSASIGTNPTSLAPGYAYSVPALDGERVVLGQCSFSLENGSLEFGPPDDLAAALTSISTEVRRTKDAI